jgi:hypothetical protein
MNILINKHVKCISKKDEKHHQGRETKGEKEFAIGEHDQRKARKKNERNLTKTTLCLKFLL